MPVFDTFTIQAPNTSDTTRAFALRQEALNNLMKPLNGFADLAKTITGAQQSQEAAEAQAVIRAAMANGRSVEEMRQLGAQASKQIDPRIWANAQGDKIIDKEIDRYITDSTDRRNWSANRLSWLKGFGEYGLHTAQARNADSFTISNIDKNTRANDEFIRGRFKDAIQDAVDLMGINGEAPTYENILSHLHNRIPNFSEVSKQYPGLIAELVKLATGKEITTPLGDSRFLSGVPTGQPIQNARGLKEWNEWFDKNPTLQGSIWIPKQTVNYNGTNYFVDRDDAGNEYITVGDKRIPVSEKEYPKRGLGTYEFKYNLSTPQGVKAYSREMLRTRDTIGKGLPFLTMDPNKGPAGSAFEDLLNRLEGKDDKYAERRNKARFNLTPYYNEMLQNGHNDQTATMLLYKYFNPTTWVGGIFTNDDVRARDLKNDPEYKNPKRLLEAITRIQTLQNIPKVTKDLEDLVKLRQSGDVLEARAKAANMSPEALASAWEGKFRALAPFAVTLDSLRATTNDLSDVTKLALESEERRAQAQTNNANNFNNAITSGINVIGDAKNMNNGGSLSTFGTYSPPPAADDPAAAAQTALAKNIISQYDKNQKNKTTTSLRDWANILGVKPSASEVRSSAGKVRAIVIRELAEQGYPSNDIGSRAHQIVNAIERSTYPKSTSSKSKRSNFRFPG